MGPFQIDPIYLDPNYRSYSMSIVDIGELRADFLRWWPILKDKYLLRDDEFESVYDWCTLEAFYRNRLKSVGSTIIHHYQHDIYSIVYEELAQGWQFFFHTTKAMNSVVIKSQQHLKVLVASYNLIIAQQGSLT